MNYTIPAIPFYFIRHGQTEWNREGRFMGQTDIPLNKTGIAQAQEAADYLRQLGVAIDRIVSSPLMRARQTAETINAVYGVPLGMHPGLKEVGFGEAEGRFKADEDLHLAWMQGRAPNGAESWVAFKARVVRAVAESIHDRTLLVAHGRVFTALADYCGYHGPDAENCAIYLFTPPVDAGGKWDVRSLRS